MNWNPDYELGMIANHFSHSCIDVIGRVAVDDGCSTPAQQSSRCTQHRREYQHIQHSPHFTTLSSKVKLIQSHVRDGNIQHSTSHQAPLTVRAKASKVYSDVNVRPRTRTYVRYCRCERPDTDTSFLSGVLTAVVTCVLQS